jgi:ABC-type dipeptide/oligopeptide/nickel transport system ATPase component
VALPHQLRIINGGILNQITDRITIEDVFLRPTHPYTEELIAAILGSDSGAITSTAKAAA